MHKDALLENIYVIYCNSLICNCVEQEYFLTYMVSKKQIRKIARLKEIIFVDVEIGIITTCRSRIAELFIPSRSERDRVGAIEQQ